MNAMRFVDLIYSWRRISRATWAMKSKRRSVAGLRQAMIFSGDNERTDRSGLPRTGTSGTNDFPKRKWFGRLMNSGQAIRSGFGSKAKNGRASLPASRTFPFATLAAQQELRPTIKKDW